MGLFDQILSAFSRLRAGPAAEPATFAAVYRLGGRLIVPAHDVTEAGFYLEAEPVQVLDAGDAPALAAALEWSRARGHLRVPTPPRDAFPAPVVPAHAGATSWRDFEGRVRLWQVDWTEDGCTVVPNRRERGGGFVPVPDAGRAFTGAGATLRAAEWILGQE